jgi:acetyl-CoA carboxylase biotin carboxyl carrier protein
MDVEQIKRLLSLVREHELAEFEIEHEGLRLRVRRDAPGSAGEPRAAAQSAAVNAPPTGPALVPASGPVAADEAVSPDLELAIVKSPIVGTFYRSAEPGAAAFVEVGSLVKKGQVLCIIEAMKLMNEIDSEYDGEVVNVYVENGQPVQYGERLFSIRASK